MKTKSEIVKNWLPRYTGRPLAEFGKYILLSNFVSYVDMFAQRFGVEVTGRSHPMQSATAEDLTILNFGMGSAMAATVMDLLSAVAPKAVLLLGKCGGLKKTKVGDFTVATPDGVVVAKFTVSGKCNELGGEAGNIVKTMGTLGVPCYLRFLPRRQLGIQVFERR